MKVRSAALALLGGFVLGAVPVRAQAYRFDIGINGGGSFFSNILSKTDIADGKGPARFAPNAFAGFGGTYWFIPEIGLRLSGTYMPGNVEYNGSTVYNKVSMWSGNTGLVLRAGDPGSEFDGPQVNPYILLGAGARMIALDNVHTEVIDASARISSGTALEPITTGAGTVRGGVFNVGSNRYLLHERWTFEGVGAFGADARLAKDLIVRFELGSRLFEPRLDRVSMTGILPVIEEKRVGRMVSEIYAEIAMQIAGGIRNPPQVTAMVPAPPPPPPPPAHVMFPSVRTEEQVSVCIIDPLVTEGMRVARGTSNLVTDQVTIITSDGRRLALGSYRTFVEGLEDVEWYLLGMPLSLIDKTGEFAAFGLPTTFTPAEMTYLGNMRGVPIFAKTDVFNSTAPGFVMPTQRDLYENIIAKGAFADMIAKLPSVYAPLKTSACVFQEFAKMERVLKTR